MVMYRLNYHSQPCGSISIKWNMFQYHTLGAWWCVGILYHGCEVERGYLFRRGEDMRHCLLAICIATLMYGRDEIHVHRIWCNG